MKQIPYNEIPQLWNFFYPIAGAVNQSQEIAENITKMQLSRTADNNDGLNSLYLHIPFCDTICTFCPFIKTTNYADTLEPYLDALIEEIKMVSSMPRIKSKKIDAIYIGGGTPSVLKPDQIKRLGEAITHSFVLANDYEWTFECAALTATEDRIKAMAEIGVNRGSFGVQTFNQKYKKMFNLQWTMDHIQSARDLMMSYFNACNMDLLYHLPGQTHEELMEDVDHAIALGTSSIDVYPLEYLATSNSFLRKIINKQLENPPTPIEKIKQNKLIYNKLNDSGYFQNYVYTFTKKEAKYKRFKFSETIYGTYEDEFIALGVGGRSTIKGLAYDNIADIKTYIATVNQGKQPVARAIDYHAYERGLIFFPKKMRISRQDLRKYGLDKTYKQKFEELEEKQLIIQDEDQIVLTDEGKIWFANIMVDLFPEDQRKKLNQVIGNIQEAKEWYEESKVLETTN
ncbi:coproporphyrinogen-III oxidase family protein [Salipaludibacillus agaradhaerens]|jgi:oxygen-independent coproporphyrinogen-3 oxidase|uniref:coproporphyrinogen-III oxidase family protein n=1 Tax=Salipaludibacillus agaradhaerens TaxID=76935 RepID=UPI000996C4C8|nr:coproporphyrinogen-III oxidase family protein [Salipaludibacillus agaradhaerens]